VTRLLLVHQPTDGGVGRHVTDLATGLAERGYEVVLCGPAVPSGLPTSHRHEQLNLRRAIGPRADLAALARYAGIVRSVRPDLIHAHSSKAGAIARLGRLLHPRIPVIYTPHGYAFAGYFLRQVERSTYREIERALGRLASRVVCVCEAEARLARAIGPADRVRVVHNGIEPVGAGPVHPRAAEIARRGAVLCALTRLRLGKGLETLIDALPPVRAHHPRVQLAIGGEGPEIDALRARSQTLAIGDAVHFLGRADDPLSNLRGSDLFVHPSWAESFPYVILEAMAVGLPIVASDVGGIGEALVDGESGLLVAPGDTEALSRALIGLLDDAARRTSMGDAAKRRVEQRFTRSAMIGRLVQVYDEVLVSRRRPSV
jgi:glycosyltransferase involved in cell wall biosynthesis